MARKRNAGVASAADSAPESLPFTAGVLSGRPLTATEYASRRDAATEQSLARSAVAQTSPHQLTGAAVPEQTQQTSPCQHAGCKRAPSSSAGRPLARGCAPGSSRSAELCWLRCSHSAQEGSFSPGTQAVDLNIDDLCRHEHTA
jgi:hypothetical protein